MTSIVPFKCYYGNEIRRINLPVGDHLIAYSSLIEQLQAAFSISPTQQLRLRWQDDEGDKVSLTTSNELMDSVRNLMDRRDRQPGQAVKIFVTAVGESATVHEGVTCDGCGCGVTGYRFKCVMCPDFDLCSACMSADAHNQHPMLLIRRPRDFSRGFRHPQPPFGGCHRRWGGAGPRFRDFLAKVAATAAEAANAEAAAADVGASAEAAAAASQPAPPQPQQPAASEEAMATEERPEVQATATGGCHGNHEPSDPRVARAIEHMRAMGFNDEGGWLSRLLVAKEGDICAVLDAIRPASK